MENEAFLGRRKNWHKKINNFDNHDSLTIVKKKIHVGVKQYVDNLISTILKKWKRPIENI